MIKIKQSEKNFISFPIILPNFVAKNFSFIINLIFSCNFWGDIFLKKKEFLFNYFYGSEYLYSCTVSIQIGHLMPIMIKVVAYGVFPQVYLSIPKGKLHQHHSIELEYSAIQSLTEDYITDNVRNLTIFRTFAETLIELNVAQTVEKEVAQKKNDLLETDMEILAGKFK